MTETLPIPADGENWQKNHNIVPVPNESIRRGVLHYAALCLPDQVHWCGGTDHEHQVFQSLAAGEADGAPLQAIIGKEHEMGAIAETHVTTRLQGADAEGGLRHLFHESMKGRTLYVVPSVLPADGAHPEIVGLQLTDSAAVASSIETAFPSGDPAWAHLTGRKPFWLCLHASGNQQVPDDRVRWEFPLERTFWAYGPGYDVQTLRRVLRQT